MTNIGVLVLGDIGRSPRMQYHVLSLAAEGYQVQFIGEVESEPRAEIAASPNISVVALPRFQTSASAWRSRCGDKLGYLFYVMAKSIFFLCALFYTLMFRLKSPCRFLLVQTPPAVPVLGVAWLVARLRRFPLIIDWHNYAYGLLAISLGNRLNHPFVRLSLYFERFFGKRADGHFCVTKAMKHDLAQHWGVRNACVLYDRPPDFFRRSTLLEHHALFSSEPLYSKLSTHQDNKNLRETLFTKKIENEIILRPDRPALIVSSTSWTKDEDFSILLDAIVQLEQYTAETIRVDENPLQFVFIITGKGPEKSFYEKKIDALALKHCRVLTAWLDAKYYPTLLGCADLGVSLHKSSSGLDLPMKVVDMFGCKTPVCAINFPCLNELVVHNHNGLVFDDAKQLAQQMYTLFNKFPTNPQQLHKLRSNIALPTWSSWYQQHALVYLKNMI